jgi:hypothetical protein
MIIIQKRTNQIDNQGHYFDYEIDHLIFKKLNIDKCVNPNFNIKNPPHRVFFKKLNQPTLVTTL